MSTDDLDDLLEKLENPRNYYGLCCVAADGAAALKRLRAENAQLQAVVEAARGLMAVAPKLELGPPGYAAAWHRFYRAMDALDAEPEAGA